MNAVADDSRQLLYRGTGVTQLFWSVEMCDR